MVALYLKTGLKINTKKTEVLKINSRSNIAAQQLNEVEKYTYLGATVSNKGGGAEDIHNQICKSESHS